MLLECLWWKGRASVWRRQAAADLAFWWRPPEVEKINVKPVKDQKWHLIGLWMIRSHTLMYCHGARLVIKRWLHGSSNTLSNMILNGPVFTSCKLIHRILHQSHFCPIVAQTKSWKPQQSIRTLCTQWCKGLHSLVSSDGAARTRHLEAQLSPHSTWQYVAWGKNGKTNIEQEVWYLPQKV